MCNGVRFIIARSREEKRTVSKIGRPSDQKFNNSRSTYFEEQGRLHRLFNL